MSARIAIGCCALAVLASACVSITQMNVIQYPPLEARLAFPSVADAARQQGYQVQTGEDEVSVVLDDSSWLKFAVRCAYVDCEPGDFVFWVILDEEKVAPADREAKFAWGARIGDEIWRRALQLRDGKAGPAAKPAPTP